MSNVTGVSVQASSDSADVTVSVSNRKFSVSNVSVSVDDDETPGVVIDAATANMDESGPLSLALGPRHGHGEGLDGAPGRAVNAETLTVTSTDADAVSIDHTDGDTSNGPRTF